MRVLVLAALAVLAAGVARAQEPDGELLTAIGGCTNCHTAEDGEPFAGGDPLETPFGTFYPPNITPDPETGIGGWSDGDFLYAMRQGLSPDRHPYYPSFPFTSYTRMTDADILAIKHYLDDQEPVRSEAPPHDLPLPYNIRSGLTVWRVLEFQTERYTPPEGASQAVARGGYLVNGPGHCQECHTPRNWLGGLMRERAFAGVPSGPDGKGGAPSILPTEEGIGGWSQSDLVSFFQLGMSPAGDFVGGEMALVIEHGTSVLPPEDREAIAAYLLSLPVP